MGSGDNPLLSLHIEPEAIPANGMTHPPVKPGQAAIIISSPIAETPPRSIKPQQGKNDHIRQTFGRIRSGLQGSERPLHKFLLPLKSQKAQRPSIPHDARQDHLLPPRYQPCNDAPAIQFVPHRPVKRHDRRTREQVTLQEMMRRPRRSLPPLTRRQTGTQPPQFTALRPLAFGNVIGK